MKMKKNVAAVCVMLMAGNAVAAEKTAEQLVAGKKQADITYRQLMEIMGTASTMINEGLVRENSRMVRDGVDLVINHPAPNHKPWLIVAPKDQEEFKKTLVAYDPILDSQAEQIAVEAGKPDWNAANSAASTLMGTCIACHASWKDKTIEIKKLL
ncbi:VOC family protein [Chlorobium phaeobacteroides]|uniref:Cytochrome c n=1 Tax=Chlorobium phaeobacteroides (strain DSM 266 / SMG 266 / 2430) TaxID=290317 RepID=A1BIA9_CHLPD|nr:hypothetical protein [Chlorobium phaeobacteroides]ABL66136.1 hypothetical protein Cpha266_2129 [Chlorobium phaeobacteroides DSM 266]